MSISMTELNLKY
uniref:Uncharacterized protein n=1 Tax=Anguilla anguilla TaxID=7936 RepID=A0A0E9Q201_ANGAN